MTIKRHTTQKDRDDLAILTALRVKSEMSLADADIKQIVIYLAKKHGILKQS